MNHYLFDIKLDFHLPFPSLNGLCLDLHSLEQIKYIAKSTDVPHAELFYDLLRLDPDKDTSY
jgi:hypothetical protein